MPKISSVPFFTTSIKHDALFGLTHEQAYREQIEYPTPRSSLLLFLLLFLLLPSPISSTLFCYLSLRIVSWSSKNLIAISAHYNFGHSAQLLSKTPIDNHGIFILDPDSPSYSAKLPNLHSCKVRQLQWDFGGQQLLSVDDSGKLIIWEMEVIQSFRKKTQLPNMPLN